MFFGGVKRVFFSIFKFEKRFLERQIESKCSIFKSANYFFLNVYITGVSF